VSENGLHGDPAASSPRIVAIAVGTEDGYGSAAEKTLSLSGKRVRGRESLVGNKQREGSFTIDSRN